MKVRILLFAISAVALTSCTAVYKAGQTPDDIYYSPARQQQQSDYVDVPKDEEQYQTYQEYEDNYRDDRFLRMSVGNPYYMGYYNSTSWYDWRFSAFNMYAYDYFMPMNNFWYWNGYYNPYSPYYGGGMYYFGKSSNLIGSAYPSYRPIAFNPGSYTHNYRLNTVPFNGSATRYNNSNNNNSYNPRRVFHNGNSTGSYNPSSNSSSPSYSPSRSYSPASSGSSSSSGSVSRPTRH